MIDPTRPLSMPQANPVTVGTQGQGAGQAKAFASLLAEQGAKDTQKPTVSDAPARIEEGRAARVSRFEKPSVGLSLRAHYGMRPPVLALADPAAIEPAAGNFSALAKPVATTAHAAPPAPDMSDVVDLVNPLHHIPFVGMAYRAVTGDKISPAAQFIGSTVVGGPIGGALAMADIALTRARGESLGETIVAQTGLRTNEPVSQARG